MAQIKLSKGLYSAYVALATKDADTVYFCTDSGHLYLGTTLLVGGSVTSVTHNAGTEVITIVTQTGTGASSTTVDLGVYLKENAAITASTGKSFVTYDTKGLVTGGTAITATNEQLVKGDGSGITMGTASGNVPVLNGSGKLADSVIPNIAITDTFVVATEPAMLALTAQVGDVAIRTDVFKSFILQTSPASVVANWQELKTPTDAVSIVNGQTGTVTLGGGDILVETGSTVTDAATIAVGNTIDSALGKLNTAIGTKLDKNAAITGATHTKITYDANGLVTSGTDLVASDIPTIEQSQVTNLTTDLAAKVPTTRTINGKDLTTNISLTGADIKLTDYTIAATAGTLPAATDTVNAAIGKLAKTVSSGVVASVTAADASVLIGGTSTAPTIRAQYATPQNITLSTVAGGIQATFD